MTLNCTWREIMHEAVQRLAAAGIEHPARDARLLLAHALTIDPVDVIVQEKDAVDPLGLADYERLIQRRLAREPVSRIRGQREFFGRIFTITRDVLDPRPETELLVETGMRMLPKEGSGGRVLDLGTGSGCILISLLASRSDASGVGLDISPAALAVARKNAASLRVADRAEFVEGNWKDWHRLADPDRRDLAPDFAEAKPDVPASRGGGLCASFDLILSNPPYISKAELSSLDLDVRGYDPHVALIGPDEDGLGAYRAILDAMPRWLRPGGWIGFEFGFGQADAVAHLMQRACLAGIEIHADLAGIPRAAFGRRQG